MTIDLDLDPARELARDVVSRLPDIVPHLPEVHLAERVAQLPDLRVPEVRRPDLHLGELSARRSGGSAPRGSRSAWMVVLGLIGVTAVVTLVLRGRRRGPTIASTRRSGADQSPSASALESRADAPAPGGRADVANLVDSGAIVPPPFLGNDPGRMPVG